MEDHAANRNFGAENFNEVPCDRFTFAVLIGSQNKFIGVLHKRLEFIYLGALIGVNYIKWREILFNIYALFCPGGLLILGRNICGSLREISNVADRGFNYVVIPQESANLARLRRGLHDN